MASGAYRLTRFVIQPDMPMTPPGMNSLGYRQAAKCFDFPENVGNRRFNDFFSLRTCCECGITINPARRIAASEVLLGRQWSASVREVFRCLRHVNRLRRDVEHHRRFDFVGMCSFGLFTDGLHCGFAGPCSASV